MTLNSKIILFFTFILGILICAHYVIANENNLRLYINLKQELLIKKDLISIANELEKTAKLYKTTDQKVYWENEAKKSFFKFLHSYGYYASNIDVDIKENSDIMTFNIDLGPRYIISSIVIKHAPNSNKHVIIPDIDKFKTKKNHFIFAQHVINDQNWLLKYIEKNNCLLSLSVSHVVTVNHLKNNVEIAFLVNAGPTATIEKVEFIGLTQVKPEYVRKLVHLTDGQCFKRSYIIEARGYLQKSNLFSSTTPKISQTLNPDGSVPVIFNLTERKSRSLKSGINYATDTVFGLGFGWEHRNFFGSGEEVKINLLGNQKEQLLELNYEKPFFKRDDQKMRIENLYETKTTKAFDSKEASAAIFIDRQLSQTWKIGSGLKFSYAEINHISNNKKPQNYYLLSTPILIGHDTRNNILNATKGYNITLETAPLINVNNKNKLFFKSNITATTYLTNKSKIKTTLALKASAGTISGISSEKIPNTEKFYVGGNNSVRGYAYQFVGNVDSEKKPIGGKSFVNTSVELRLSVTDEIGIVSFIDSGYAYNSLKINKNQDLLHGAGLGFRYITGFGPLRADIGIPLTRRKFIDKSFHFYFGIGQSF